MKNAITRKGEKADMLQVLALINELAEYEKAPKVTRDRLYLDALQGLYSNSTKVLMDVEGGNNLMYLPLDKILEQNRSQEED